MADESEQKCEKDCCESRPERICGTKASAQLRASTQQYAMLLRGTVRQPGIRRPWRQHGCWLERRLGCVPVEMTVGELVSLMPQRGDLQVTECIEVGPQF